MTTRKRWLLLGSAACVFTTLAAFAPSALRRMDSFRVQHVEISGTKYLPAYDALVQTGITRLSNVFDEYEPWRQRLLRHPMVVDADIERALPSTIKVNITEAEPVAFIRTPELRPVDARNRALPIDPTSVDLDLPLITPVLKPDSQGFVQSPEGRAAVAVLHAIEQRDARLYSWISDVTPHGRDGLLMRLRTPLGAQALLPADPRTLPLRELEVTLSDLNARGELARLKTIDLRFRDQVVVSLKAENRN